MGMIFKEIGIVGLNNGCKQLIALFDTGASCNFIGEKFKDGSSIYDLGIVEYQKEQEFTLPDGKPKIGRIIKLKILKICGESIEEPTFCLWKDMRGFDVIIGAKLMQQLNMILKPSTKEISFE